MGAEHALALPGASTRDFPNLRPRPPFPKGASGNPTGRPKGQRSFAAMIRARTHQGRDLLEFVFSVLQDESEDTRIRLDAATWLANRAFGPPMPQDLPAGSSLQVFTLTIGDRDADDG